MCEVTSSNFEELLPQIEDDIHKADFIALDTEFTGLHLLNTEKNSLFDNGEARYKKLRECAQKFTIVQLGISTFVAEDNAHGSNRYRPHTYNFYLYPVSFGPIDAQFTCQASSLKFLCKHGFDFNKFVCDGIPYMNAREEQILRKNLDSSAIFECLERDVDEQKLREICSKVADWLTQHPEEESIALHPSPDVPDFIVVQEILKRFPQVWAGVKDNKVVVEKVSAETRFSKRDEQRKEEERRILEQHLGFTRLFRTIVKCKKPLIGHNNFTDLILIYQKFHKPLPESYAVFKEELHYLFPIVFDTKHMVNNFRRAFEKTGLMEETGLAKLYQALTSKRGQFTALYSPYVALDNDDTQSGGSHHAHEAGYDALMAGTVFLSLAHIKATEGIKSSELRKPHFDFYIRALESHKNCVNIIRATVDHVKIDDLDPASRRPQWLFVSCRKKGQVINAEELAALLSQHGSVDIRCQGTNQALVAISNYRSARDILRAFQKHERLRFVSYDMWTHSKALRGCLWAGVLLFGGLSLWTLVAGVKQGQVGR